MLLVVATFASVVFGYEGLYFFNLEGRRHLGSSEADSARWTMILEGNEIIHYDTSTAMPSVTARYPAPEGVVEEGITAWHCELWDSSPCICHPATADSTECYDVNDATNRAILDYDFETHHGVSKAYFFGSGDQIGAILYCNIAAGDGGPWYT
eukprot:Trichotokara_eunicae@DN4193_c0_g1_i1.p1